MDVRRDEVAAIGWSWLFFFCVLSAYYVIRPIRDDMGVAGGVRNLPWLFTGSLIGMLLASPAFSYLVGRLPRARFVTASYRFFALNLLLFFATLHLVPDRGSVWVGRAFFVWTSVFNMFVVSIFWSVITDVFSPSQGKRLFGFVSAGGTIGSIMGSAITSSLVGPLGATNLLVVSIVLLEAAGFAARRILRLSERRPRAPIVPAPMASAVASTESAPAALIGGSAWDGFRNAIRSPYLRGIVVHMLLFTVLTTFLYFQQAAIVDTAMTDRAARTRFFANIDLLVNVLTLLTQVFATGRLVHAIGLPASLAFLPVLTIVGFTTLGMAPTIAVLMAFQVIRRSSEFAIARPSREVLFTVVSREDRYKAKNFIDTFVYRAGDQLGAWGYAVLVAVGLGTLGISSVAVVLSVVAVFVALWLGRRQRREAAHVADAA